MKTLIALLLATIVVAPALAVEINEIRIDQPSSDYDEYFELMGTPEESLAGYFYIVIGDSPTGTVEAVVDLGSYNIQLDGLFCMGESTFSGTCGSTDATGDLNFENSDNVTHMLVTGFTGAYGDLLDTDADGVLDVEPWSAVIDCVGLKENDEGEYLYCGTIVGPDGTYAPGHVLKCGSSWAIGDFELCIHDTPGEPNDPACAVGNETVDFGDLKARFR